MAKTKQQKKEILEDLKEKVSQSKSIVFTSFNNLKVKENEELRSRLKEENCEYCVAKKTLLDLALKNSNFEVDVKNFDGKIAAVFSYEDEVAPAKTVDEFRTKFEDKIYFLGAILEGKFLDSNEVTALAKLPSKQELYAKIVGSLNAPVSGFVNVLAGNLKNLVYVLKAIEEKKA